jgi:hypothetical protein
MKTYAMLWNQTTLLKTSTYLTACRSLVVNNFPLIRRPILAYQPIERRCPECLSSVLLEMACKIDLLQNKWSLFCYLILIYHKRLKILPQFESGDLISIFPFLVLAFFTISQWENVYQCYIKNKHFHLSLFSHTGLCFI